MEFLNILKPEAVKFASSYSSKKRLFSDLGAAASDAYGLDSEAVTTALLDREALGPTGVGHGIALPHARLDGLEDIVGLFVRIEKPTEFSAVDKQPVAIITNCASSSVWLSSVTRHRPRVSSNSAAVTSVLN